MTVSGLQWQPTLVGGGEPEPDAAFAGLRRHRLDATAWVDHCPGWLRGSDEVFATLVGHATWEQPDWRIYGERRPQPRLSARLSPADDVWGRLPVLEVMRELLGARYGVELTSVGVNLYRDGRDSVAWHGDRIPKEVVDPLVAIVSAGAPRRFLLRPRGGGPSVRFHLGAGDLLVTGGSAQRTWEHAVPKVAAAGPRISITYRHGLRA